jgi:hypothetical protein
MSAFLMFVILAVATDTRASPSIERPGPPAQRKAAHRSRVSNAGSRPTTSR